MNPQSTTQGNTGFNIPNVPTSIPVTPQQNNAFAAPQTSNSGSSIWSGIGGLLNGFFGNGGTTSANQTTTGGTNLPSMGSIGLGNMGVPYSNPSGGTFTPTSPSAPLSSKNYVLNGQTYDASGAPVKNASNPIIPSAIASNGGNQPAPVPKPNIDTTNTAESGGVALPPGMKMDANGNIVPDTTPTPTAATAPNMNPQSGNTASNPATNSSNTAAPDRIGQINALTQAAETAGNITPAEQTLRDEIAATQESLGIGESNIAGNPEGMQLQTGQSNVLQQQGLAKLQGLTSQLANLQAARAASLQSNQQALGGAEAAAGLQQPVTLNPAQTLVSPYTGSTIGSGGNGGTAATVTSLAKQVANGQMSEQQAQSMLPDPALAGQLNQAILGINPNFSAAQSAENAAVQGALPPAAQNATSMLTNLQTALQNAPALEKTSVPLINSLSALASGITGIGGGGTQGLQSALTDARAALANALGAANNSTPSTYDAYVKTLLPDGITQPQLASAIQQFQNQIAGKEAAYGNPGAVSSKAGQAGANAITVGGTTYAKNAQGVWEVQG